MSLRYQISIRIFFIALCILILGGSIAIWQARSSVSKEVDSSINLALQLIKLGIGSVKADEHDWLYRFSALDQTRHLKIQLKQPSGDIVNITQHLSQTDKEEHPPAWFINLVMSDYPKAEYPITTFDKQHLTLIIQANPLDEITEAWHESIAFFSSVLALVLLTFLAVNLVFNKALKAIATIVESLQCIETGVYQKKLPYFATQEYDSIAKAINHMTDVLESTQLQNRSLTQHSLNIQEEERRHLAQELHDELGQSLTAIKVMSVTAAHKDSNTTEITTAIIGVCDHLMTVVRSMMQQLHPLILTELGLAATLEDLVSLWNERNPPMHLTLSYDAAIDKLNKETTIQIYRVIQECLTNIVRHAQASQAAIDLKITPNANILLLQVTDNGQGCCLDKMTTGFGLLGIKERIKSLAGDFDLQSLPGKGMKISASIPVR
ncbi:MAG: histidine kinase [Methylococcaceae bacterium]|nr:histidine kinase [Methylococcaceae bacterium]